VIDAAVVAFTMRNAVGMTSPIRDTTPTMPAGATAIGTYGDTYDVSPGMERMTGRARREFEAIVIERFTAQVLSDPNAIEPVGQPSVQFVQRANLHTDPLLQGYVMVIKQPWYIRDPQA